MFKYSDNRKSSLPGQPQNKVVVEIRHVTYRHEDGRVSHGSEIVREVALSPDSSQPPVAVVEHKTVLVQKSKAKKKKVSKVSESKEDSE
jgi:hypothetical protein